MPSRIDWIAVTCLLLVVGTAYGISMPTESSQGDLSPVAASMGEEVAVEEDMSSGARHVAAALSRAREGLLAWWGPSAQTLAELDAAAESEADSESTEETSAINAAYNRLMETGADVNDIEHARFAEVELSTELSAALSQQLSIQAERRAEAVARQRLMTHTSAVPVGAVCSAIVDAFIAWKAEAKSDDPVTADDIIPAVVAANSAITAEDVKRLFEIVRYRIPNRGGEVAAVCDVTALSLGLRAKANTAVPLGGVLRDFAMGLEEEYSDIRMNPDSENVAGLATSGNVPKPRVAPYLKVCPDHTAPPAGYPPNTPYGIIEMATGPLPISWEARQAHRDVANLWRRGVPKPSGGAAEGPAVDLLSITNQFNAALPRELANYATPIKSLRYDHEKFGITNYPNTRMPINSMQTNFEASICALFQNRAFLELNWQTAQKDLWRVARAAADAFVSSPEASNRMPGVTAAEVNALPAHQICELKGLMTVVFLHSFYWGVSAAAENVKPKVSIHPNGGTPKNFFSVMVKTNIRDIVDRLPYPLSDVVHQFHTAANADAKTRLATLQVMHNHLFAALENRHPYIAAYRTDVFGWQNRHVPRLPATPWLARNGEYFSSVLRSIGARPYFNPPSSSPIGDRGPPASIYRNPAATSEQQIVVVCEARFQTEPMNRAMTEGMAVVPRHAGAMTKLEYAKRLVNTLKTAVSEYVRDK